MSTEQNPYQSPNTACDRKSTDAVPVDETPVWAHVFCGWPLVLVAIGGMIGGLLGVVAYGINMAVFYSKVPMAVKIPLIVLIGVVAIIIWFAIALVINAKLPIPV